MATISSGLAPTSKSRSAPANTSARSGRLSPKADAAASTIFRHLTIRCTMPTSWEPACWPALIRTFRMSHSAILARKAMQYTAKYQRPDYSWYYGEAANLHWVDNFQPAYVLDCFQALSPGHWRLPVRTEMMNGYWYWKETFFLPTAPPGITTTRHCLSTFSVALRPSTPSSSSPTVTRKVCHWRER